MVGYDYKNLIGVQMIVNRKMPYIREGDILCGERYDSDGDLVAHNITWDKYDYVFKEDLIDGRISIIDESFNFDSSPLLELI